MGKKWLLRVLIVGILCFSFKGFAQEETLPSVGLGVKIGTPGVGIEVGMPFTSKIGGRLGLNYFTYSYDTKQEGIEYDANLNLFTIGALVDWYPTGNIFRLTGGLLYNGNEVKGKAKGDIKIGDNEYTDVKVKAGIDFDDIAPYVGIGWDTSFGAEKKWGFIGDIGFIYHGIPHVSFSATGTGIDPDDVKKEKEDLEDSIKKYEWYPVVTLGFIYRF